MHRLSLHFPLGYQKKKTIFHQFSYRFPTHGLVVITGDSGIGKSSLMKVIAGQLKPTQGKVKYQKSFFRFPPVYLSDQLKLIASWPVKAYLPLSHHQTQLSALGLETKTFNQPYGQLSGGQQIRLAVSVFLYQPAIAYLLDEPTHALDLVNREKIIQRLKEEAQTKLIITASHDPLLIAAADASIHMVSPYHLVTKVYHSPQLKEAKNHYKAKHDSLIASWRRRLIRLPKAKRLGRLLGVGSWMLLLGLYGLSLVTFRLNTQWHMYQTMVNSNPWFALQETTTNPIRDSPFQLVKTSYPNHEAIQASFLQMTNLVWLEDISYWFPPSIIIDEVTFLIRFTDLPFRDGQLSVAWIHPPMTLPKVVRLTTLPLVDQTHAFSFQAPTLQFNARRVTSWFEPPQMHVSYWQWHWLLHQYRPIEGWENQTYFDALKSDYPPPQALIYDPEHQLKTILISETEHTTYTLASKVISTYPWIDTLLKPLLTFLPWLFISLFGLWLLLGWTRLHWLYQQHQQDWQWLLALHVSFHHLWHLLTKRLQQSWLIQILGLLSMMTIFMAMQPWLSMPSWWVLLLFQMGMSVLMTVAQRLLVMGYRHA